MMRGQPALLLHGDPRRGQYESRNCPAPNYPRYISAIVLRIHFLRRLLAGAILLAAIGAFAGTSGKEPLPDLAPELPKAIGSAMTQSKGKSLRWSSGTWYKFCVDEAPFVDKLGHELADKGLVVLAINVGESKKTVKKCRDLHPRNCKSC
jgi:hypothetical protein